MIDGNTVSCGWSIFREARNVYLAMLQMTANRGALVYFKITEIRDVTGL